MLGVKLPSQQTRTPFLAQAAIFSAGPVHQSLRRNASAGAGPRPITRLPFFDNKPRVKPICLLISPPVRKAGFSMRIFISYHTPDGVVAKSVAEVIKAHRPMRNCFLPPKALCRSLLASTACSRDQRHPCFSFADRQQVGKWQELEYLEAVRLARDTGKPLIVPVVMGDYAPGLPFFDQYHRLFFASRRTKRL